MSEKLKHWIYVAVIIVLLALIFIVYHVGATPYKQMQNQAIAIAKKNTNLKTAQTFYLYNRNQQNWTVGGTDKSGHAIFVIIDPKNNHIVILSQNSGVTQQTAVNKVINQVKPSQIHNVALGIYHKKPIWEVTFKNKNNTIGYETIDFKTGRQIQLINDI